MRILTGCYKNAPPRYWQRKIQLARARIQLAVLEKPLAQIQTRQNEITIAFWGRWIPQILKPGSSVVPKSNRKHFRFSMDCITSGFLPLCIKRRGVGTRKFISCKESQKQLFPSALTNQVRRTRRRRHHKYHSRFVQMLVRLGWH